MKKIILGIITAMMMTACCENQSQETASAIDSAKVVTDVMMSRRSIRAYKDSVISKETLNEILKCGINAPNGKSKQSYEIRVINSIALIDSITAAVVNDNPQIAEREGFKNIFVNAPCVICIAYDKNYDMSQVDCGLLGENIILSAWSKGIGSCCLGSSATLRRQKNILTKWIFLKDTNFSIASLSVIQTKLQMQNPEKRI